LGRLAKTLDPKRADSHMKTPEEIESATEALPLEEYMRLVHWLAEREWIAWGETVESDSDAAAITNHQES